MSHGIRITTALLFVASLSCHPRASVASGPLATIRVASGLARPLFVTAVPGDTTRIFILEQYTGNILIVKNGHLLARPFLTIPGLPTGSEQGLLGLAFHPNYAGNGYLYVTCTRASDGAATLRRFHVSGDPDRADSLSGTVLLAVPHPQSNHNGGWVAFGPDGYLYMTLGDGGNGGDQGPGHDPNIGNAQSDTTRLGKMLRLDVNGGFPYAIPPGNPFSGAGSPRNEFWAKGLRNAWRCSFDRQTGDLYIADVGQDTWEEIDFQPAAGPGGRNYGWRNLEGFATYNCPGPCDTSAFTPPIFVYPHFGAISGCAIAGGYCYRGAAIPSLQGTYLFSDYCTAHIWSLKVVGGVATGFTDLNSQLSPSAGGFTFSAVTSFGEDARGEMYFVDQGSGTDGQVFKIVTQASLGVGGSDPEGLLRLSPARPNPASHFSLNYSLARASRARLDVFDARGGLVRTVSDGFLEAGSHAASWDGRDAAGRPAPSGTYLLRLDSGQSRISEKLTLLR
jgi:glucose/arabinose dehydrogenase